MVKMEKKKGYRQGKGRVLFANKNTSRGGVDMYINQFSQTSGACRIGLEGIHKMLLVLKTRKDKEGSSVTADDSQ